MGIKIQFYNTAFFAFTAPLLAMYAPLSIAPVFGIMAIYPVFVFMREGSLRTILDSSVNKIFIVALMYALISTLWAIAPKETLHLWVRMSMFFIGGVALVTYARKNEYKDKIFTALLCGIIVTIVVANIESLTDGLVNKTARILFEDFLHSKAHNANYLEDLNRGASFLSIITWPMLCYLFDNGRARTAIILFAAVLGTIMQLDSFSSIIGFIIGGIVFTIVYCKKEKALKVFAILVVIGVFSGAGLAKIMDANKLIGNVPVVPGAASNMRLYIWDYAAEQAYKKPIFGWGFNASRSYPVQESEYVDGGRSPLPLHPHNNTLQVWLELGLVGLVLFSAFLSITLLGIASMPVNSYIMAAHSALFANYFVMGQTGYGIWQNWWVASIIIVTSFLKLNTKNN